MIAIGRRRRAPDDAPLQPGERVLAVGGATGVRAVATDVALLADGGRGWVRLPWWEVLAARWDGEAGLLHVQTAQLQLALPLDPPGALPEAARERVQASIVISRHVPVRGRLGVRLVARRVPGQDDPVWQQVPDPGLDVADPRVAEAVRREQALLRSQLL